jgi:D-sedoheptulose 7-phosphate isomerase
MQPPYERYMMSLGNALGRIECEIGGGMSLAHRGVDHVIALIQRTMSADGSVWLVGNGGSGTIADHIACDMVKMRGWRAFALTNPALTTTYGNDDGYAHAFGMQLAVLARPMDVVIGMSCSGESANVLGALSNPRHVHISLTGFKADNRLRKQDANVSFYVPSMSYGEVQIAHLAVLHAIIDLADGAP